VLAATAALLGVSVKNAELFGVIHENSVRDGLTGCFNRKHAIEVLEGELRRSRRAKLPVSMLMFDLYHFKAINDTFGHLCGDAVLSAVGARMNAALRGSDLKCRYGGEEFLVILPDTPLPGACRVAETLPLNDADRSVPWNDRTIAITARFGIAIAEGDDVDAMSLLERADRALYSAKQSGRNCVRIENRPSSDLSAEQPRTAA
jgi:diguanylate cyclase (GGDEF)-like protein